MGEGEERRKAIKEILAENGFVEGRNLQFEVRWGDPYEFGFLARDGGLKSYRPNLPETGRRVGDLVVRILRGARAADLPLEQPTHLEFVVNLRTAKSIGLDLPPSLVSRADEVIE